MNRHARRNETMGVKKALKTAGFTGVRVGHGTGTSWCWLDVAVDRQAGRDYGEQQDTVLDIVRKTSGRDRFMPEDDQIVATLTRIAAEG